MMRGEPVFRHVCGATNAPLRVDDCQQEPHKNAGLESAGINGQEAENENFSREGSSDPLGPEFCAVCREVRSEA